MLKNTLPLSIPVAMGYIPLGMVFGFLLVQQTGLSWWWAGLMSVVVYAGAMQFLAVALLVAHAPLWTIALATVIVNLRHVFYGLSLLHYQPRRWWARAYMWFSLTDETYSLLTTLPAATSIKERMGLMLLNQGWWVLGTCMGAILGGQVSLSLQGLDFSLLALFAVLAVEQWKSTKNPQPFICAALAYPLAYWLVPTQALMVSIVMAVMVGVVMYRQGAAV